MKTSKKVLILRTCDKDMKGRGGFQWPKSGPVSCPDWDPKPECGGGLHGLLWGEGDYGLLKQDSDNWIIFEADASAVVDLEGKVKVPAGEVLFVGDPWKTIAWLNDEMRRRKVNLKGKPSKAVTKASRKRGATVAADGYLGSASATGYLGSASATGYLGSASATGYRGSASATGDLGSASATGDLGSASATGHLGSASATGYLGSASATGDRGSASATGDRGSASATGDRGCALMWGLEGKAMAGKDGVVIVSEWDDKANRPRVVVGYVGEAGIEKDVWYSAKNGKLAKTNKT